MGYIEDSSHFANYCNKYLKLRDEPVALDDKGNEIPTVDLAFLQKEIYAAGHADQFTWVARNNPTKYLSKANVLSFIKAQEKYRESHPE